MRFAKFADVARISAVQELATTSIPQPARTDDRARQKFWNFTPSRSPIGADLGQQVRPRITPERRWDRLVCEAF
jgi:hypothetical protein